MGPSYSLYHTKGNTSELHVLMQLYTLLTLGPEPEWGIPYRFVLAWQSSQGKGH